MNPNNNEMNQERPLCLSVSEAARSCRLSKSLVYDLIRADLFPHCHFGEKRVVVPVDALRKYLAEQGAGTCNHASKVKS